MLLKKITISIIAFLATTSTFIQSYKFKKLTVLTNSSGKKYGGHYAVTRSLIEGLQKIGANFNYNPKSTSDIGDVVVVLAGIPALKKAINLKKKGVIKKLLAGPNLVNLPHDHNRLLGSPELDVCIVNSYWTRITYLEDMPSLEKKISIWPAGVNSEYWKPTDNNKKDNKNVLVYVKFQDGKSLFSPVAKILKKYGWNPIQITYGSYNINQFKNLLSQSKFAVFLSRSESQGIALAEAWSMNVPTLPWDPGYLKTRFWEYKIISSCPYLTNELGIKWKTLGELEKLIKNIDIKLKTFRPREWLLENMSDEVCAQYMIDIIEAL